MDNTKYNLEASSKLELVVDTIGSMFFSLCLSVFLRVVLVAAQ